MKEELTTKMHSEFIGSEISDFDLRVMAVYGATARGVDIQKALAENDLSMGEYESNIKRVLLP